MNQRGVLAFLLFTAISLTLAVWNYREADFQAFWSGAQNLKHLYDPNAIAAVQTGLAHGERPYLRPPFVALCCYPLGKLPYPAAYALWTAFGIAALEMFRRLWGDPWPALLFIPLFSAVGMGQDAPLLLLVFAVGVKLIDRHPVLAGLVLALLSSKPHLTFLVPVALLFTRRFRAFAGLCAGGAGLYVVSAAVSGWAWPLSAWRAMMEGQRLRGSMGLDWNPMQVVALSVAPVLLWYVARRRNTRYTLAYALALGVVGSPRLLLYELALALPFITTLGIEASILFGVALATVVTPAVLVGRIAMVVIELIPLSGAALGWVAWIREAVTEVFPLRQGHE